MLVLTRHTNQKVLFPNLGITVQVVETRRGSVRLGIDAPPEIRIIRDELFQFDRPAPTEVISAPKVSACEGASQFRSHLDAANLAIHLAQNQLRQGLNDHAAEALQQALESLQALEQAAEMNQNVFETAFSDQPAAVRESSNGYAVHSKSRAVVLLPADEFGVVPLPQSLSNQLRRLSVDLQSVGDGNQLIDRVRDGAQLDLLMVFDEPNSNTTDEPQYHSPTVRIPGVVGFTDQAKRITWENRTATVWASARFDLNQLNEIN